MRVVMAIFCFCWLAVPALAMNITLTGEVSHTGTVSMAKGSRINDVLQNYPVSDEAYFLGAAWYRESAKASQQRLKAGLLFDLQLVEQTALLEGQTDLANLARQLYAYLAALPVTGRIKHNMDPAALLATDINHPLKNRDTLFYPPRPLTVQVMGAVEKSCAIPFAGMNTAEYYLAQCAPLPLADNSFVYVIQPDGAVFKQGIALWNRELKKKTRIAPGAVIWVSINEKLLEDMPVDINEHIADFLATQAVFVDVAP